MRIDFVRAGLAGLAGTVAFDLVGLILGRGWWDIPQLLGMKLGGGLGMGILAHYVNGFLIAAIFAGIAPSLWGSRGARALIFTTAQTVFGAGLFMMPPARHGHDGAQCRPGHARGGHDAPLGLRSGGCLALSVA